MNEADGFDIHRIREILPHRFPFLLVDRVLEYSPGKRIVALKNVTINEPYFMGHFPSRPVMPGVLALEAMAQTVNLFFIMNDSTLQAKDTLYYLTGVENAKFRRPVEPGDQLVISVEPRRIIHNIGCFNARAQVGDTLVASAELWCGYKKSGA